MVANVLSSELMLAADVSLSLQDLGIALSLTTFCECKSVLLPELHF